MSEAVATYAKARAHPDAWILERFVLKTTELNAFEESALPHLPRAEEEEPWPLSVLVRHDADGLAADVGSSSLEQFNDRHVDPSEGFAIADVVEIKGDSPASIEAALNHMPDEVFPFFELDWRGDIRDAGHHCRRRRWCSALEFGCRRLPHFGSHGQILARCCFGRSPTEEHGGNALASSSPVRRRRRGNGPRILNFLTAAAVARIFVIAMTRI